MTSSQDHKIVWIGFLTYGTTTAPYLPYFLSSLRQQTYQDYKIVCFDNTPEEINDNRTSIEKFPEVTIYHQGQNLGFSAAYNYLLQQAVIAGAEYFLIINPDTILDPAALDYLVTEMKAHSTCVAAVPKIRQWNFQARTKTSILDSCGLVITSGLRFIDLGQGEEDRGQYDHASIIGPSGAAGLFRLSMLEHIAVNGQYFDEAFFMYKEDCDLNYRLSLAGYHTRLVSRAIIYHDRTASGGSIVQRFHNRRTRSVAANRYAFINQHFLYIKYWRRQNFYRRLRIIVDCCLRLLGALTLEWYLLSCYPIIIRAMRLLQRY